DLTGGLRESDERSTNQVKMQESEM
ncbi:MAG: hypothetical protein ACI861_002134, partial [Paracoccaceae bacterium]